MMNNSNILTVNLNAITNNYNVLFNKFNYKNDRDKSMIVVMKSDAYGFGAIPLAHHLVINNNCKKFAVSTLQEAIDLRIALISYGKSIEIITLNGFDYTQKYYYKEFNITPIISSLDQWDNIDNNESYWVHFDTGMNRTGIPMNDWEKCEKLMKSTNITTIMSHLSHTKPQTINENQLMKIKELFNKYNSYDTSLLKTSGLLLDSSYYYNNLRSGHGLYFHYDYINTEDIGCWESKIQQINSVKSGDYIGYNSTFRAKEAMRVAIVNTGYSHGIQLNHPYVIINNEKCPIVGTVSMEFITVDITNVDCDLNTPIYIFRNNWIDIAKTLDVSCGFLSCGLNLSRKYVI